MTGQVVLTGCLVAGLLAGGAMSQVTGQSSSVKADLAALPKADLPGGTSKMSCDIASFQASAPSDTTISSARNSTDPVSQCIVEGYVTTTNPGPNKVNFALHLPTKESWNGRYYFGNQGGSGGSVPIEAQHPQGNPLNANFAWAGTDKGHSNVGNVGVSGDWQKDPAKALDNAYRGAHVVTVATQQMTKAYYGVEKMYRYAGGCSGGGGMGQSSVSHYPEDFDGVMMGGQTNSGDPLIDQASILPCAYMGSMVGPAGKDIFVQ